MNLEQEIRQLELDNAKDPTTDKHNKITLLKFKLNRILLARVVRLFQITKQENFEFGDKPHKLLAGQLKIPEKENTITKIISEKGKLLTLPKDINKRFAQFYQNLYTSKTTTDDIKITNILDNCNLSKT